MKARSTDNKRILKRLFKYISGHAAAAVFSLITAAAYVVLILYIPVLTGNAIDLVIAKDKVDFEGLKPIILKLLICIGCGALSQWLMTVLNNHIAFEIVSDIRDDAFKKLQKLPVSYFDRNPHGDILSRITNDAESLSDGLLIGFTKLFSSLLTILVTLFFMIRLNPLITVVVVVVTPVSLFVAAFIAKRTHAMFLKQSAQKGEQTSLINEAMFVRKAVYAYNMQDRMNERFDRINEELADSSLKATFFSSLVNPSTRFVNSLVYAGVGIFGAISAINGMISVGQLSAFLAYAGQYTKPFNEISSVITELQNAIVCAGRVFDMMDEDELPVPPDREGYKSGSEIPAVAFDNVVFSYVPEKPLITGFSLDVKEGQRIAIVGPTGCGKTTMINLLMHFYEVKGGSIKLYGRDVRDIPREELRSRVGMVLQDTWIRKGTVRDNIAMNRPDATEEEIVDAAKAAYAHSFIKRLPNGYDTVLSENGEELSQGQRQLICIARVMLKTPSILVLDEATSSIDTRTEIKIQKAFDHMMEGRTNFVVAHRLSTIMEADNIIVMNNGNIVETGTHEELLKKKGFYKELYDSQF
ncbi:MAG: ABC transporter ATP-binding protein [Lachnospiraceae bacterium]|nr:ABC transporter ATP-binding protein [Lachnospiraceae bacterium]